MNFLMSKPITTKSNAIATTAVTAPTAMAVYLASVTNIHAQCKDYKVIRTNKMTNANVTCSTIADTAIGNTIQ